MGDNFTPQTRKNRQPRIDMQVTVHQFFKKDQAEVKGSCGDILGVWKGPPLTQDDIGQQYNIELCFLSQPDTHVCHPTFLGFQTVVHCGKTMKFKGLVEQVYADGVIDFRLSEDLIVLLRVKNKNFNENDWISFELDCSDVEIYPY